MKIQTTHLTILTIKFSQIHNAERNHAMNTQGIYDQVTTRYSAASRGTALEYGESVAKAFGYSEEELADIPKESNLGLSCGNPMAMASIREVGYQEARPPSLSGQNRRAPTKPHF